MNAMGTDSSVPQMPHSQVNSNNIMNTATAFMRAMRPDIQVVTNTPIKSAMATELPATASAGPTSPNCTRAAMPVATAVSSGPKYGMMCSAPATTAHVAAFSRPNSRNATQDSRPSTRLVTSIIAM